MTEVTFRGSKVKLEGIFPSVGEKIIAFSLCRSDLSDINSRDLEGKNIVLSTFPSLDTPTCAASVRTFNKEVEKLDNTRVLCISADLPFSAKRFCEKEGIENVEAVSFFRSPKFAIDYGVLLGEGILRGLSARATIVVNPQGRIVHTELVKELSQEPNYSLALNALSA